jgi:hypothetical protein
MILFISVIIVSESILPSVPMKLRNFYLGGRSLGPWVAAFSAEAYEMRGWLLLDCRGSSGLGLPTRFGQPSVWRSALHIRLLVASGCVDIRR